MLVNKTNNMGGGAEPELGAELPALLLQYAFDPAEFARVVLGWTPDERQASILRSTARRVILNCSRQWGKTTVAATKILHMALTRPGVLILILAENLSQTSEVFEKIDSYLARLGIATTGERGKAVARRIVFNGSRIVGIASREQAGRGYTADLVFVDEAARVDDEVIDAFKPTVAVRRGDWWMASTPQGRRGRFFEAWTYAEEGPEMLKVKVPASENSRIPKEFLDECRREKGDLFMRVEFECEFLENGTHLMSVDEVDRLARGRRTG